MAKFCSECGAKRGLKATACTACGHTFEVVAAEAEAHADAGKAEVADEPAVEPADETPAWAARRPATDKGGRRLLMIGGGVAAAALAVGAALAVTGVFKTPGSSAAAAAEPAVLDLEMTPIAFGDKCGFVDSKGKLVINPQFDAATYFVDDLGLAPVSIGGKWGLIDRRGEYAVNPQFDFVATAGNRPIFKVRVGDQWGTIDRKGAFIINPQFDGLGDFDEKGRAVVIAGGKWGMIDQTGKYVVTPQFEAIGMDRTPSGAQRYFTNGLAPASLDGKWGFINEAGAWAINPQFAGASHLDERTGLAPVMITKVKVVENTAEAAAWDAHQAQQHALYGSYGYTYEEPARPDFSERTETQVWGYADRTGKIVITPQFEDVGRFNASGLAPVKVGGSWGFIDAKGAFKVNPQFAFARGFADANGTWLAAVATKGADEEADWRWGVIDATGAYKVTPQFSGLADFDADGRALASVGDNVGMIDLTGRFLINPVYFSLEPEPGGGYLFSKTVAGAGEDGVMELGRLDRNGKVVSTVRGSVCSVDA